MNGLVYPKKNVLDTRTNDILFVYNIVFSHKSVTNPSFRSKSALTLTLNKRFLWGTLISNRNARLDLLTHFFYKSTNWTPKDEVVIEDYELVMVEQKIKAENVELWRYRPIFKHKTMKTLIHERRIE